MFEPLVTIVTPTYNAGRYIERCVESVLAQSYGNWEQVIVDDGSTDDTLRRISSYSDQRIKVIPLPHRGLSALHETYNAALSESHGSLVAILEGDDCWPREKLEIQTEAFKDESLILSWGRALVIDSLGNVVSEWVPSRLEVKVASLPDLFLRLAFANVLTPSVSVMARRSALNAVGGFQQRAGPYVDLPTWLLIAAHCVGDARKLPHVLGYYRVHAQQTTYLRDLEMLLSHYDVVRSVISELSDETLERVGWDAASEAETIARNLAMRGAVSLRVGQFTDAGTHFTAAFHTGRSARLRLRALIGLLSVALRYDVLTKIERRLMSFPRRI